MWRVSIEVRKKKQDRSGKEGRKEKKEINEAGDNKKETPKGREERDRSILTVRSRMMMHVDYLCPKTFRKISKLIHKHVINRYQYSYAQHSVVEASDIIKHRSSPYIFKKIPRENASLPFSLPSYSAKMKASITVKCSAIVSPIAPFKCGMGKRRSSRTVTEMVGMTLFTIQTL